MSVRKLTFLLLAAAALLVGQRKTEAQEYLPVADPFRFEPDFKWFEPVYDVDLADMKPSKRASTGWYGTFDRMKLWFSRPDVDILREGVGSDHEDGFDSGWGNRIRVGYMLESGSGWSATYFGITGPSAAERLLVERINRVNEEDFDGPDFGDDETGPAFPFDQFGRYYPSADRNLPQFNERLYELTDSINILEVNSFEINKTWRMEPYHYGGILEPLVGFRYFSVTDRFSRENYIRGVVPAADPFFADLPFENLSGEYATTQNHAFGGQLGARYFKFFNRFTYSAEFRAFAMQNWQSHRSVTEQIQTIYDGIGLGSAVQTENLTRGSLRYRDNQEFLLGFDVRAEAAYQVTRMFQLRGGFQLIDLSRGIWRGEIDDEQDQRVMMVGATFGFSLNY